VTVKTGILLGLQLFLLGSAWSQSLTITNVVNSGNFSTTFGPSSVVYIMGSFPKGAGTDFSITVGGQTGAINTADDTVLVTATLPTTAPTGAQTLILSYQGTPSNAFPITILPYAPVLGDYSVTVGANPPPVYMVDPPFNHYNTGLPVTAADPAQPNELLTTYPTGLGQFNPPTTGPPPSFLTPTPTALTPTVTVNGLPAQVEYSGTESVAVVVAFIVPANAPAGTDAVVLSIGGFNSNIASLQVGAQPPAFFTGEVALGANVLYLQFPNNVVFGYFTFAGGSIFYHYDMGFEAYIPGSGTDIFLYDFTSGHWWYTSASSFPSLYDFSLNTWIYYFPNTNSSGHYSSNPRYFANLTTSAIFTM
jgi:uncharacterized protein (TIGR03437 family)